MRTGRPWPHDGEARDRSERNSRLNASAPTWPRDLPRFNQDACASLPSSVGRERILPTGSAWCVRVHPPRLDRGAVRVDLRARLVSMKRRQRGRFSAKVVNRFRPGASKAAGYDRISWAEPDGRPARLGSLKRRKQLVVAACLINTYREVRSLYGVPWLPSDWNTPEPSKLGVAGSNPAGSATGPLAASGAGQWSAGVAS